MQFQVVFQRVGDDGGQPRAQVSIPFQFFQRAFPEGGQQAGAQGLGQVLGQGLGGDGPVVGHEVGDELHRVLDLQLQGEGHVQPHVLLAAQVCDRHGQDERAGGEEHGLDFGAGEAFAPGIRLERAGPLDAIFRDAAIDEDNGHAADGHGGGEGGEVGDFGHKRATGSEWRMPPHHGCGWGQVEGLLSGESV